MEQKNKHSDTVTLFVKVIAKPESTDKTENALLEDVHGAWTEKGNVKMELYEANEKPGEFFLFERWSHQSALESHFNQPYTQGAFDLQKSDLLAPIEMNYLTDLWPLEKDVIKQTHKPLTTLIVTFKVKKGNGPALVKLFEKFVPLVRKEKGNVEFHFHSVKGNDNLFVLYERWESQNDLNQYNQQQTTAELVNNVSQLIEGTVIESVLFLNDIS